MSADFEVTGQSTTALFTLKIHRGDGMALLAMNWKTGKPPDNFVGFAIEYKEPGGNKFFALKNRIGFPGANGKVDPNILSTLRSPIQKFRWVHFPRNADMTGDFTYRVTPVFMNASGELSLGDPQTVNVQLCRETYPGQLNIGYTRGFVASQGFVDKFGSPKGIIPQTAGKNLDFKATNLKAADAQQWMGFEAYQMIIGILDKAVSDTSADVRVVAYDLNEPDVVSRLEKLGSRLKIIIDNSGSHGKKGSDENEAETRLKASGASVQREHMGSLQHNKFIAVRSAKTQMALCGSTNYSWRAFFVQNNNAVMIQSKEAVDLFFDAFDGYSKNSTGKGKDDVAGFAATDSADMVSLGLTGIDAQIAFSPHNKNNALLQKIADDIQTTTSSLFYSLAFLAQTGGPIRDAIKVVSNKKDIFVYGIADKPAGGIVLQKPDGNLAPVSPAALTKNLPQPFKAEPTGGAGVRMHHKFVVIDFDKPTARVYMGSYNFSKPADLENGENLALFRDRRIAVSYLVEALSMFDHYHFRLTQQKKATKQITLAKPPQKKTDKPWWDEYYTDPVKVRDRELFA